MTRRSRRNHSPAFKAKVAIAAIKGEKTVDAALSDMQKSIESASAGQ